jgi:hypothetical protein
VVGRRSVWSDERLLTIAAQFVPAADEVWRLQNDDDAECRWFRTAVRGTPAPSAGTMQGIYVLTPAGRCLGQLNSNDPDAVLAMLEQSLQTWRELPPAERRPSADQAFAPTHRWEQSCPDGGLVLERFARDIGDDPKAVPLPPVNVDAVWFTRAEAAGLVPERREVGAATAVSPLVLQRLAQFALVDNVRGQTLPFAPAEVEGSTLRSEITAIDGERLQLAFSGTTRAVAAGPWLLGDNYWRPEREWPRRLATRLAGRATYDTGRASFVTFELVAIGERHGRTTFNGRHTEDGEDSEVNHRIGFLLRLAPIGWRVAPTFVNLYGAEWVVSPGSGPK